MKYMTRLMALGLFAVGSVVFVGCGETTTTTDDDTPAATTPEGDGSGSSEDGDSASTEPAADEVAQVSFKVNGMK